MITRKDKKEIVEKKENSDEVHQIIKNNWKLN